MARKSVTKPRVIRVPVNEQQRLPKFRIDHFEIAHTYTAIEERSIHLNWDFEEREFDKKELGRHFYNSDFNCFLKHVCGFIFWVEKFGQ